MLVAVIADTHMPRGSRRLPEECVRRLRAAELILHAGDFVGPEVLSDLESLGPPVAAVHGNVDAEELRRRLPAELTVRPGGTAIGLLHDAGPRRGRLERLRRRFPEASAVVFAHSHIPLHEEADGFQVFNPGSPTDRRRQPRHTMGEARVHNGRVSFRHVPLD